MPSSATRSRVSTRRTASGSAPTRRSRAPVRRWISGHARSSTCIPFRGSCLPMKTMRCSRSAGSASGGTSTPFGTTSYSPGSQRAADSRACSDTAIRLSMRAAEQVAPRLYRPYFSQRSSPLAWNVATVGPLHNATAATPIAGVIGSCTWMTSKRSRSKIRLMRRGDGRAEHDVRQRAVRRHDHGAPDGEHVLRRIRVPPEPGMQHVRERSGRVVADHEPRVDPEFAQREQLLFSVIDDSTPERP